MPLPSLKSKDVLFNPELLFEVYSGDQVSLLFYAPCSCDTNPPGGQWNVPTGDTSFWLES